MKSQKSIKMQEQERKLISQLSKSTLKSKDESTSEIVEEGKPKR